MKLIGLCGTIGSGKDTIADYLCKALPAEHFDKFGFHRMVMADVLKDITATLFSWDRDMIGGLTPEQRAAREHIDEFWSEKLGRPWSPRIALQYLGTELFRDGLNQDIWVHVLERKILDWEILIKKLHANAKRDHCRIIISDIRFPNEVKMIKRLGGEIWRVRRGEEPEWFTEQHDLYLKGALPDEIEAAMLLKYPEVHASEWSSSMIEVDLEIDNSGTLEDLYKLCDKYSAI